MRESAIVPSISFGVSDNGASPPVGGAGVLVWRLGASEALTFPFQAGVSPGDGGAYVKVTRKIARLSARCNATPAELRDRAPQFHAVAKHRVYAGTERTRSLGRLPVARTGDNDGDNYADRSHVRIDRCNISRDKHPRLELLHDTLLVFPRVSSRVIRRLIFFM